MTRDQHLRYIPNLDPSRKKINVIARLKAFVNNPNIKAIGITTYERGFVVLYEEAESDLRNPEDKDRKKTSPWMNISHAFASHGWVSQRLCLYHIFCNTILIRRIISTPFLPGECSRPTTFRLFSQVYPILSYHEVILSPCLSISSNDLGSFSFP